MIAAMVIMATGAMFAAPAADDAKFKSAVQNAYTKVSTNKDGKNADYIPALARVDPRIFGLALVTVDGRVYTAGDMKSEVSIQSISKVFTLALVLEQMGADAVEKNIGVDATGQPFNSIVAIEQYRGAEMNPLVNPGAITATSMVRGNNRDAIWRSILSYYSDFAGRPLSVDQEVYKSEAETNQRNQALASLMYAYGHIKDNPAQATDIYTQQCAVSVNARDLAIMAATLANGGKNPVTGRVVMKQENVAEVLSVMATAGLYDDSGKWLYKTGAPAKSGVGGGLIAVVPGKFGIAAIAPPLDQAGNSVKGQLAIEEVIRTLGANPYDVKPSAAQITAAK
jgi:glutaminase